MKKITLTFAISLTFVFQSIGQINPVQNLTWEHWYEMPNNFFILEWEEPAEPHDEIIGYNIYQEDDLYLFISGETSIYNKHGSVFDIITNCGGESFLFYNGGGGYNAHVTAVYNPDARESAYTETVYIDGPLLKTKDFDYSKAIVYPNPSTGIINLENKNIDRIILYDISGRVIRALKPQPQIDLSSVSKGVYLLKLISGSQTLVDKIILE